MLDLSNPLRNFSSKSNFSDLQIAIISSIVNNDEVTLLNLLTNNPNISVDIHNENYVSACMFALSKKSKLFNHLWPKSNKYHFDNNNWNTLNWAVNCFINPNDLNISEIEYKNLIKLSNHFETNPLISAISFDKKPWLEFFLKNHPYLINTLDKRDFTPLICSIKKQNIQLTDYLIENSNLLIYQNLNIDIYNLLVDNDLEILSNKFLHNLEIQSLNSCTNLSNKIQNSVRI